MKKLLTLALLLMPMSVIFGLDVPEKVKQAFNVKYPGARSVKWELNESSYEAEFKWKGKHYEAEFDAEGKWLLQSVDVSVKELPVSVKSSLDSLYAGAKIREVEYQESANQGPLYIIEVRFDSKDLELYFTSTGQFLYEKKD